MYGSNIGDFATLPYLGQIEGSSKGQTHVACQVAIADNDLHNRLISCRIIYQSRVPFDFTFTLLLLQVSVVLVFEALNETPPRSPKPTFIRRGETDSTEGAQAEGQGGDRTKDSDCFGEVPILKWFLSLWWTPSCDFYVRRSQLSLGVHLRVL